MGFFVNAKFLNKCNVILNETVTKLFTILTKSFFPYLNPTQATLRRLSCSEQFSYVYYLVITL